MAESASFDVIILGASGYTGKYVVREALKFWNSPSSPLKTLALAGRSPSKLQQALNWATHPNPPPPIPILTADTSDPASIRHLCTQTKLILNCVGPFIRLGEPIVAACAETGCDYLDISGEADFVETTERNYHEQAMKTGSLVISACGFSSVSAELGWMFNSRQWDYPSAPNQIQAYVSFESQKKVVLNFGSFETMVLAVENDKEFQELRSSRPEKPRPVVPGALPHKGPMIEHQTEIGAWAMALPAMLERTLPTLVEYPNGIPGTNESDEQIKKREAFWSAVKPAHFEAKSITKTLMGIIQYMITGIMVVLLGRIAIGRKLLLKYPSFFSLGWFRKKGPTEEEVRIGLAKVWFVGRGFSNARKNSDKNMKPDMEVVTRITAPEAGYVATPIILVQCALILLSQRHNLPKGGVLPPGLVFGPTHLQERLQLNGISFDFISKKPLPAAQEQ